jgi:hypothetical protein
MSTAVYIEDPGSRGLTLDQLSVGEFFYDKNNHLSVVIAKNLSVIDNDFYVDYFDIEGCERHSFGETSKVPIVGKIKTINISVERE